MFIDNVEGLDIFKSMYNLLEHSINYSLALWNLLNYYRDKLNADTKAIVDNSRLSNNQTTASKYSEYKTKTIGRTAAHSCVLNTKVNTPSNNLGSFWRTLDFCIVRRLHNIRNIEKY